MAGFTKEQALTNLKGLIRKYNDNKHYKNLDKISFINFGKLLKKDTDVVKNIKSLLDKEEEYSYFLGAVEFSIAKYFMKDKKLKDKEVIKILKNLKANYVQDINFFDNELEKDIMLRLSLELQEKRITHHELKLVFDYILWTIDNRSWLQDERAYTKWIAYSMGLFSKKEEKEYQDKIRKYTRRLGIPRDQVEIILINREKDVKIKENQKDATKIESEFFALSNEKKFDFVVQNGFDVPYLIGRYTQELIEAKDYKTAEKFFKKMLEIVPEFPPIEIPLGALYKEMGNNHLAEYHLNNARRILQETPEHVFQSEIKEEMMKEIDKNLIDIKQKRT